MDSRAKSETPGTWAANPGPAAAFDRRPGVRQGGKLFLDGGLAALAWVGTSLLLGHGLPAPRGVGWFTGAALLVHALFRFSSQHYRLVGLLEARGLLLGSCVMAAGSMLFCFLRGPQRLGLAGPDVFLGASLLTGTLWFGCRMAVVAIHGRWPLASQGILPAAGKAADFVVPSVPRPSNGPVAPASAGLTASLRADPAASLATGSGVGLSANAAPALAERTLIVGAGRAGMRLCQELREHPRLRCQVVGFVDDAPEKQGVRIQGIPVLGTTRMLPELVREQRATLVVLGMAGVPGARLRELSRRLQALGVRVKIVPGILDLVGERPWRPELRDIAIEDLLRREPVSLDTTAIRQAIGGSVTLITGAGGSIGSELARRVAGFQPGRLVLLGRGENSLWEIERELKRLFPAQPVSVALCDIRNPLRLRQVFQTWRPQVVFHAAAHKHVPYLEQEPDEAIGNNILGTRNVVRAALDAGTATFVNISTDKAVNPVNVLGVSKRIGEHLVLQAAREAPMGTRFVSVRFGNVLGSRGSVIPLFREQIRQGGPITVTHPDMVRYFMTIPEACQLVLQAGILGATGKVFALDMGEPVHIVDLALDMARICGFSPGVDMDIQFTGPRPGEKFFEELFTDKEERKAGVHPKVFEAVQDPKDPGLLAAGIDALQGLAGLPDGERQRQMLAWFMKLVPVYRPSPEGLGRYLRPAWPDPADRPAPADRPEPTDQPEPARDDRLGVPG